MMKLVVLSCVLAAASAGLLAPIAYSAPFGYSAPLAYASPLAYAAPFASSNYRGPLSLAPGQPANILASDGRPLDTLEVNLDKSAHLTAKALDGSGIHILKKRSAPLIASVGGIALARSPLIAPATYGYSAPLAYASTAHIAPYAYSAPIARYW